MTLLRQVQCSFACNEFSTTCFWICGWCKGWTYFAWFSVNQTFVTENLPFIDHFHIQSFGIASLELRVFPRSDCRIAATPKTDGEKNFLGWSFIFSCFRTFRCLFGGCKRWIVSHRRYPAAQLWFYQKKVNKTVGLACETGTLTTVLDEVQGCPRWIRTYGHDWLVVEQTTLTYSLRNWHTTMLVSSPIWKKQWHSTVAVSLPHFLIQIHFQYHLAGQNLILHNQNVCLSHTKYQTVLYIGFAHKNQYAH